MIIEIIEVLSSQGHWIWASVEGIIIDVALFGGARGGQRPGENIIISA
jgi:hypothetical protein